MCPPQESISDFYWYYSGKDVIDEQGKRNFSKAMAVAKQVFNSLTEYIQGPCTGNQQSLAHSRLWDAVVGFLHVFAHMMKKLAQVGTGSTGSTGTPPPTPTNPLSPRRGDLGTPTSPAATPMSPTHPVGPGAP
ncbi:hypothetical protein AV530_001572 [Patagioenas fasciata monilis]|uniref:RyR/IP3R Homology associated domain-containing protein n=1 Tax=Patagioenas fasciata monilis TaxID=372326 RepID=A0A1V4JQK0_PATFA|nr:hypothetical protein AV530_001572 [Patagioenas fasciata monilis]